MVFFPEKTAWLKYLDCLTFAARFLLVVGVKGLNFLGMCAEKAREMTEGSGIGYTSSSPETKSAGIDFGKFFRGIGMRLLSGASLMLRGTFGSAAK